MDLDDAAPQPARRASSAHGRPSRTPSGPRIRTRQKQSADLPNPGPPSADGLSPPDSPTAHSTAHSTAPSIDAAFAHSPLSAPPLPSPTLPAYADAAVQAPFTPPPASVPPHLHPPPSPSSRLPASTANTHTPGPATGPPKSAPSTFIAPPPLTPPPTVTFDSSPIPWKGLPYEAAQWSFSSSELQDIVSKAIRLSARESFVRLLSLQALEVDIVYESQRLDTERAAAQAKWRFEVGRRTMLMQALNSSAASSVPNGNLNGTGDGGGRNLIMGFIGQLAASIASCDSLLASIFHFADQQSQITLIQHQHWASALGVALRKLNRAYERQGQELKRVQARVQTLEDELEEAWREAEKVAIEFDDFEHEVAASTEDGSDDVDERLEVDLVPDAGAPDTGGYGVGFVPGLDARQDPDDTGTLGDATISTDIAVVRGVTATAVASKATLVASAGSPASTSSYKFDTKSIRSVKSTRSRKSIRDGPSHVSRLSAARTRSRTASNASLRLPKALRSAPSSQTPSVEVPPIPALPQDRSFLDMGNNRKDFPPQRHPEPTQVLPTPPHSAGLPQTHVPTIWLETDGGQSTRLNGLDRSHSLQIFSSLMSRTPRKARRSNLVMSLTESDRSSEVGVGTPVDVGSGSVSGSVSSTGVSVGTGRGTGAASPTSNSSPVSLPTHALAHFRGPSVSSSLQSIVEGQTRPGSAGARLTTTGAEDTRSLVPMPVATPRRSLMSRASSVILRRLSQATTGGSKGIGGAGAGADAGPGLTSPSKSRGASRPNGGGSGGGRPLERWGKGGEEGGEEDGEGEVMLIGSPDAEALDAL